MKAKKPLHVWILVREFKDGLRWPLLNVYGTRADAMRHRGQHAESHQLRARKFIMEEPKR